MKNIIYLLLFLTHAVLAQPAFEKGNEQYRHGQYSEAAATYESILKDNKESSELYFNLGNAYFKQEKVAPAVYNYEKALLLDPGNRDIEINLRYAQQLITENIEPVAQPGFAGMINNFSGTYHYDTWGWMAVISAFGCLLLFSGYYITRKSGLKRAFFVEMSVVSVILVISLAAGFYARSEAKHDRAAIVFSNMVQVKTEPSANAQDAFILHEGVKVYVIGIREQWDKVQLPDGTVGWIPAEAVKEIAP